MAKISIKSVKLPIEIEKGATFNPTLTYYQDEGMTMPVDLTGYTARMKVKERIESVEHLFELTTENGGIILGDTDGTIKIYISAMDTAAVPKIKYVYSLELVTVDGIVIPFVSGPFMFYNEVTD
jgi:hypothetical protein